MTTRIQSEIRVADILAVFEQNKDNFYICYVVANQLRDQIEKLPGYHEFKEEYYSLDSESDFGEHYSFLLGYGGAGMLCDNVVGYFNTHIEKHFPDTDTFSTFFYSHTLLEYQEIDDLGFFQWNRVARIKMLQRILKDDPEAVISINIEVGQKVD